jgi:hypothetical protein
MGVATFPNAGGTTPEHKKFPASVATAYGEGELKARKISPITLYYSDVMGEKQGVIQNFSSVMEKRIWLF